MEKFDVAIRPRVDDPLGLFDQRLITTQKMQLYASEEYVSKHGAPSSPEDLPHHKLLGYGEGVDYPYSEINWHLYLASIKINPTFNINSGPGILRAVENGIGIGPISNIGATISRVPLVPILPSIKGPLVSWYFIVDKTTANSEKVKLLYAHLQKRFQSSVSYSKAPSVEIHSNKNIRA